MQGTLFNQRAWRLLGVAMSAAVLISALPRAVKGQAAGARRAVPPRSGGAAPQRRAPSRTPAADAAQQPSAYKPGQKIEAMWGTKWLPATVLEVGDPWIKIRYDEDGFESRVFAERIRPRAG